MCSEFVSTRNEGCKQPTKYWIGWKVFAKKKGHLHSQHNHTRTVRKTEIWLKVISKNTITASNGSEYTEGWHIFTTKKAAMDWCRFISCSICKVRYRKIIATGEQIGHDVIVAKEIYILPNEVKRV